QQLSVEGLVKITPRVGVFVREISVQEITDVYQIKTALEPLMASWAAERGSEEQRVAFHESLTDLEQAANHDDVPSYVRLLEQRREALLAMAASDGLRDALGVLAGRVRLLEFRDLSQAGRLAESATQHRAIADAIAAGDPEAAYTAMQAHLQHSTVRIQELLASVEDPAVTESPESSRRRRAARTPRRG
ncbi:GntR family transcriptional regulator, partial [Pseudonocardia acaciae]|uniref:GntR family transcriptional regulator n=1 Tax=Pseudonocardia acaciae TaxID=551276 RepID=UPI00048C08EC